jgi:hypothetical protein
MTGLGRALETNRTAQAAEVACVLLVAVVVISVGWRVVGSNLVARQAVVWIANILMLVTVWIGLRVRGQTWESIGLPFRFGGFRALGRTVLKGGYRPGVRPGGLRGRVPGHGARDAYASAGRHERLYLPAGQSADAAVGAGRRLCRLVLR